MRLSCILAGALLLALPVASRAETVWDMATEYPQNTMPGLGVTTFAKRLEEHAAEVGAQPIAAIAAELALARRTLSGAFAQLSYIALERPVHLPGQIDAWGAQRHMHLRQHPIAWLNNEPAQTAASRKPNSTPPHKPAGRPRWWRTPLPCRHGGRRRMTYLMVTAAQRSGAR